MPQPKFVTVRPMSSRMIHSNGVSPSASMTTARPLMRNLVIVENSEWWFSRQCAGRPARGGNLRLEVRPGRQIRARAPQEGRDASDVGVVERRSKARHYHARYSVLGVDAVQDDLNEIVGLGQMQRAVERKLRPDREGRPARIVVTGLAGCRGETRVRVVLAGARGSMGQRTRDRRADGCQAIVRMVDVGEIGREGPDVLLR